MTDGTPHRKPFSFSRLHLTEGVPMLKRVLTVALTTAIAALGATLPACAGTLPPNAGDFYRQVLSDRPAVYLRLNETSGTVAKDYSGNQLNGTYGANILPGQGTTYSYQGLNNVQVVNDLQPRALFPAGITDTVANAIVVPTSALYQTNTITYEALVTMPGNPFNLSGGFSTTAGHSIGAIATAGNAYPNNAFDFNILPTNGHLWESHANFVRNGNALSSGGSLFAGSTYLLDYVYDGSNLYIYIDGVLSTSTTATGTTTGFGPLRISIDPGATGTSNTNFEGSLSEVSVYPTALSAARIYAHALAWKAQPNNVGAATTTTPGTTTGPLHALNALNLTSQYTSQTAAWTSADWAVAGQFWDVSPRTDVTTPYMNAQHGNNILAGQYVDLNRSCTVPSDGSITCGGAAIAGPTGGSAANALSLNPRSLLHTCDGTSNIYWNNQLDGHNTINDPTSGTLAQDFNTLFGYKQVAYGQDFVTLDNFVLPTTLVNGNAAGFRIYDPKSSINPLQAPNAAAYGITNANFACMDSDPLSSTPNGQHVLYSDARWFAGWMNTIKAMNMPVFMNWSDADFRWLALMQLPNLVGFWHENSYGGSSITNEAYLYQAATGELTAAKAGRWYIDFDHMFDGARTNSIQLTRLAMASLMFQQGSTGLQTDGGTSPATYFVPTNPEIPEANIRSLDDLREGDVWVRRYRDCFLNGVSIGRCAAIVGAGSTSNVPSSTVSGYTKLMSISNYTSGTTYIGSVTTPLTLSGLAGTISVATGTTPTTLTQLQGVIVSQ